MEQTALTTLEGEAMAPLDNLARWQAVQAIITQVVPPSVVKTRPGRGGKSFSYVPHNWVTKTLNDAFGFDWDGEVLPDTVSVTELGVLLFYRLTVRVGNRTIVKTEPGWKENITNKRGEPAMSLGDQVKSAASDGLRRCAMRLGLGLNLYGTDEEPTQGEVKSMLASYAERHLGWDARQTFDWLKEQGYSASDLMPKRDAMYRALAEQAGKAGIAENFDAPGDDDSPDIGYDGQPLDDDLEEVINQGMAEMVGEAVQPRAKLEGVGKSVDELVEQGKQAMAQEPTIPDVERAAILTMPDFSTWKRGKEWTRFRQLAVTELGYNHEQHVINTLNRIFDDGDKATLTEEAAWTELFKHQASKDRI